MDMDDAGSHPLDTARIAAARARFDAQKDLAGVFANQRGLCYDLWALRAADWCPDDVLLTMAIGMELPHAVANEEEMLHRRILPLRILARRTARDRHPQPLTAFRATVPTARD